MPVITPALAHNLPTEATSIARDGTEAKFVRWRPLEETIFGGAIVERFEEIVARCADKIAVDDGRIRLTYWQLREAALHLAHRIQSIVPVGRPVAVVLDHGAFFPIASLACLAAGRPYVPIDRAYPAAHNVKLMNLSRIGAVITARSGEVGAAAAPCLDIESSLLANDESQSTLSKSSAPGLILYTSGSTGEPKGIYNDEYAILQRVLHQTATCHLTSDDRFILLSSHCTIAGVRETYSALLNGATLHVADPHRLGISGVLRVLHDARITVGYTVPALLRCLLNAPAAADAFSHFRIIRVGGDTPLATDIALIRSVASHSSPLISFSSTEVPTVFQWFVPPEWLPDDFRMPIGFAQPGFDLALLDPADQEVPTGEIGELVVRSRYLARGYWQEGAVVPGPFVQDEHDSSVRMLHTGDLVRLRPDGLFEMCGRKDHQIKLRGFRVHPSDAEAALRTCPRVADVAVISRRAKGEVTALVAFVVPRDYRDSSPLLVEELHAILANLLPAQSRPAAVRLIASIPKLPGFKVNIRELEKLDREQVESEVYPVNKFEADPRCPVHNVVETAWSTVFNQSSCNANMTWEDAGGDSLDALRIWFLIEETLGPLPLELLEAHSTPSTLATAIERHLKSTRNLSDAEDCADLRQRVFFTPPYDGDIPLLVRFRARLQPTLRFSIIQYPRSTEMIKSGVSLQILINAAVTQILAELKQDEHCYLAGYSTGGVVAWEAARRLRELGYLVDHVAMIDTYLPNQSAHPQDALRSRFRRFLKSVQAAPKDLPDLLLQSGLRTLIRASAFSLLHIMHKLANLLGSRASLAFHWRMAEQLRLHAFHKWNLRPLDVPTTLFRSKDPRSTLGDDGWGALCRQLTVVEIGGSHFSLLEPPLLQLLCEHFLEALGKHDHGRARPT